MAKVATVHVEIKPVLNEQALAELTSRIEDAVADAVSVGMTRGRESAPTTVHVNVTAPTVAGKTMSNGELAQHITETLATTKRELGIR